MLDPLTGVRNAVDSLWYQSVNIIVLMMSSVENFGIVDKIATEVPGIDVIICDNAANNYPPLSNNPNLTNRYGPFPRVISFPSGRKVLQLDLRCFVGF
jgi:hypothetical protein